MKTFVLLNLFTIAIIGCGGSDNSEIQFHKLGSLEEELQNCYQHADQKSSCDSIVSEVEKDLTQKNPELDPAFEARSEPVDDLPESMSKSEDFLIKQSKIKYCKDTVTSIYLACKTTIFKLGLETKDQIKQCNHKCSTHYRYNFAAACNGLLN